MDEIEVPPNVVIDTLRNTVAQLNDDNILLRAKLDFANQVIAGYQQGQSSDETPDDTLAESD